MPKHFRLRSAKSEKSTENEHAAAVGRNITGLRGNWKVNVTGKFLQIIRDAEIFLLFH